MNHYPLWLELDCKDSLHWYTLKISASISFSFIDDSQIFSYDIIAILIRRGSEENIEDGAMPPQTEVRNTHSGERRRWDDDNDEIAYFTVR